MKLWKTLTITLLISLILVSCTWVSGNIGQTEEAAPSHSEELLPEEQTEEHAETSVEGEETSTEAHEGETPTESSEDETPTESSEDETPSESAMGQALIVNDEGGPVSITGLVEYTNGFFTLGVAEPVVILEDQAGFVDRNEGFIMPVASQTLGQITSDFYESPFSYSIALPIEPQGTLRDVDHDGEEDRGVQIFAIAYWTNTFGDPFLEERDLSGGGWSTAYASTRVSEDADTKREIVGGHFLIYAPDDQQAFPSGFGADGLLFSEDDPILSIPQGYTVVDMDSDPFTFDRSRQQAIDLIEPEGAALVDLSAESYTDAFNQLVDKLAKEYAFTEYKGLDWEALRAEFGPRFEEADAAGDPLAYKRALRDFAWSIPDGHVSGPTVIEDFSLQTSGGIGLAIRELDDGRVIVNYLLEGGPATEAAIELKAEILSINEVPINEAINNAVAHSAPFSTEHFRRLQKLRYAIRFPVDSEVQVAFKNPGSDEAQSATLPTVPERESFSFSSFNVGVTGFELPVEYKLLEESGYGYVKLYSFSDNNLLTIQLWERMIRSMNENGVKGLIVDMRQNGGGSGFLADQMAAYFFNEELTLGNTGYYNEGLDDFYFDSRTEDRFYLPAEELRYNGAVTVLVGANCASACEFFSYDMSLNLRVAIVGQYPTAGLGGSIDRVFMPEAEFFTFTQGRAVDGNGEIHIEGKGVQPNIVVALNEETLFSEGDPILEAGISYLDEATAIELIDGGSLTIGESKSGQLTSGQRVRYSLTVDEGDKVSIFLEDPNGQLDTILALYDEGDHLLLSNDNLAENTLNSALEELEIPRNMGLIVEIATVNDIGEGLYTLNIVDPEEIK
jgi:C-terminal processing protease CtpA/Prc